MKTLGLLLITITLVSCGSGDNEQFERLRNRERELKSNTFETTMMPAEAHEKLKKVELVKSWNMQVSFSGKNYQGKAHFEFFNVNAKKTLVNYTITPLGHQIASSGKKTILAPHSFTFLGAQNAQIFLKSETDNLIDFKYTIESDVAEESYYFSLKENRFDGTLFAEKKLKKFPLSFSLSMWPLQKALPKLEGIPVRPLPAFDYFEVAQLIILEYLPNL